ncbi:MAG: hypoxanthine phosphoribosyltransferase [Clostridiales bacterium]|nr:MAG: hypoxanthine phosphoribosyltransferase [Clostridiales bacterium]
MIHDQDMKEILFSQDQLKAKIAELGAAITRDYAGKKLLMVSILKGSIMVMADLMRAVDLPLQIDFMNVSSYGAGTASKGSVKILKDLDVDIKGLDVLIVEDILDSGITLYNMIKMLQQRHPNSIEICTLFSKPSRRQVEVEAKYIGFEIPDAFIVGYGLDYAERYRNVPYVGVLKEEVYGG